MIVIGTSTGGPKALVQLFENLPVLEHTCICVVQHMPPGFTANLAKRLNQSSAWHVLEASHGMPLQSAHAYVAPGGYQTRVVQPDDGACRLQVAESGAVNGHQPSVDVLFHSVAENFAGYVIAVVMTGMGKDGALGLQAIRRQGGHTIAEDESSCVVYGMPKAAVATGAVVDVVPLQHIHERIQEIHGRFFASTATAH